MLLKILDELIEQKKWKLPEITGEIPHGDMPGDKIEINEGHIKRAAVIFPLLLEELRKCAKEKEKLVVAVCGGSGVGKSEIAALLSYYLGENKIKSYTLSGDNYPRRIPMYNDAERLHIFRESAVKGMIKAGEYKPERIAQIQKWQEEETDADKGHIQENPWFISYLEAGRQGLDQYLGTPKEINFAELEEIVKAFKEGEDAVWLKRMGRKEWELWYEKVDFSDTDVLMIEWTHGNSDCYQGVDVPILLNSTPAETLEHRRSRNRDGKTDSPFTTLVLEVEQEHLASQAHKAKLIFSKTGELLSYEEYQNSMKESEAE